MQTLPRKKRRETVKAPVRNAALVLTVGDVRGLVIRARQVSLLVQMSLPWSVRVEETGNQRLWGEGDPKGLIPNAPSPVLLHVHAHLPIHPHTRARAYSHTRVLSADTRPKPSRYNMGFPL